MDWRLIAPWLLLCAFLMISNVATFSWSSLKVRPAWRFMALALVGLIAASLIAAPWVALIIISVVYAGLIPLSVLSYAKVKRARRASVQAA
jgi:CDP-diacylglycerol--serine O-phosphatidyltransferase